jgi:hypothetical protein
MKKLQLSVESLRVDSFVTDAAADRRGTVQARSWTPTYGTFCWPGCGNSGDSCEQTCTCNTKVSECYDCEI